MNSAVLFEIGRFLSGGPGKLISTLGLAAIADPVLDAAPTKAFAIDGLICLAPITSFAAATALTTVIPPKTTTPASAQHLRGFSQTIPKIW